MITKVEARTDQGSLLILTLMDPSNGYALAEIEGLDPVAATLVTAASSNRSGVRPQSARKNPRDLTLKIDYVPDFVTSTVQGLRQALYDFFTPPAWVNLRFYLDTGLVVNIRGQVETFNSPLFTDSPKATIGIQCYDPDFIDNTLSTVSGVTTYLDNTIDVQYTGTADTGFVFTLNVDRTLTEFSIYNTTPDGSLLQLDFAESLIAGDVLQISTIEGNKGASLIRSGVVSSMLRGVSPSADWVVLQKGLNELRVYAEGAAIPFTIAYNNYYGGL